MEKHENSRYQRFIGGELVDLCVPSQLAIDEDDWTEWFNQPERLQATGHGIFPNHKSTQQAILESLANDRSKIVLLVCEKSTCTAIGVVSLQNINMQNRSAEIAINMSDRSKNFRHSLGSLEAMALITQHGFEEVGLIRIYAGQVYPLLENWNKMMETIGYRTEGILRNAFVRGHRISDTAMISCLYDNYLKLKNVRGSLWGSSNEIRTAIKSQPKTSYTNLLSSQMNALEEEYFKFLFPS